MKNDDTQKPEQAQAQAQELEDCGRIGEGESPNADVGKTEAGGEGGAKGKGQPKRAKAKGCRTDGGRQYRNPVDYAHPYGSMLEFALFLALHYDANRTRHAYYYTGTCV